MIGERTRTGGPPRDTESRWGKGGLLRQGAARAASPRRNLTHPPTSRQIKFPYE